MSPARLSGYAVLVVFAIVSLLPVWVTLKTALSHPQDVFTEAANLIPHAPTLGNFARALGMPSDVVLISARSAPIDFALALRNSVIYAALLVTGQLFFSALAAYAFARLRFPGRDKLFVAFIAATMIPSIVLFIPNFVLIRQLGLINTFAGMVAPNILMVPFAVFFLRQFFISSPKELEEAARLEGLGHFQIFWHIALPVQKGRSPRWRSCCRSTRGTISSGPTSSVAMTRSARLPWRWPSSSRRPDRAPPIGRG